MTFHRHFLKYILLLFCVQLSGSSPGTLRPMAEEEPGEYGPERGLMEIPGEDGERRSLEQERTKRLSSRIDDLSLKHLGIMDPVLMAHCPQTDLRGVEEIAKRDWNEVTNIEKGIKNFLQYGKQLPLEVLEVLLPMFWETEPFKSKGFILVGFPNTAADMDFLNHRNCLPETVFVLQCEAKTMHNRLIRKTVDDWFTQHPGEKSRIRNNLRGLPFKKLHTPLQDRKLTVEEKEKLMNEPLPLEDSDDEDSLKAKDRLYKDTSVAAMISRNLHQWHRIYSKDLKQLKVHAGVKSPNNRKRLPVIVVTFVETNFCCCVIADGLE